MNDMEIDTNKLTHIGSMNYMLQISKDDNGDTCYVDQYQPRRNRVWSGEMDLEETRVQAAETIERMKIAIQLMQEFIDGKRDGVYFWQFDDEDEKRHKGLIP